METIKTKPLSFNVLETIQKISIELNDSELNPDVTTQIKTDSLLLADYLDITEEQAWLFSIIYVQQSMFLSCDLSEIMSELGMKTSKFLKYRQDIVALIDKKIIKSELERRKGKITPRATFKYMMVCENVLDAVYHNIPLAEAAKTEPMDIYEFCNAVSDFISERSDKNINTDHLFGEVSFLETHNSHIEAIDKLSDMGISLFDRTLLYEICDDMVRGGGETAMEKTIKDIYDTAKQKIKSIREITENNSRLMEKNLITIINATFVGDIRIVLTDKAIEILLGQDAEMFIKKQTLKDVISADSIAIKQLYFDEKFQKQIDFLQTSLMNEKFTDMQARLQEMAMPKGVAAVFYGAPGTGKTESVYQIAKATGRDVLYVDISQTKSMWFGESEKRIKAVFNDYSRLCKKNAVKPILLFNEADAVLGKRKDNNASNVAQTENAIQNIILEQIEKSEGIIIATTNLVDNLDSAFERRFLFKLKFEMPTVEAKKQIWKSKLNWLNDTQTSELSARFHFSGGEIDNIARKAIINEVITGNRATLDELTQYCECEKISGSKGGKLGFN
ncbi:ATP-binding protein [Flavobacterium sp. UBA6031]|uniref:ATP-binding protein n=1 Tax=Flavobacterium sp. UBA6031 TaxID=1946551 RepID=UPI0025BFCA7A|nr:ATP-binding protein [Flavobacterium sp. UBA6031]